MSETLLNYDELLDLSVELGYRLLENGAEIYRVEESIGRILTAYGLSSEVFAIPSCIITTICIEGGQSHTRMKRIITRGTNLHKVSALNNLCRSICTVKPPFEEVRASLNRIVKAPVYAPLIQVLAGALISFAFCLFFGGGLADAAVAIVCGSVMKLALNGMEKFHTNTFFQNVVGSAIVSCIAFFAVSLGLCSLMDKIIIGTLMNLVPGVAITNSMRDIIAGDLLAGLTKLTEALMVAVAIALGTGIALYGLRLL